MQKLFCMLGLHSYNFIDNVANDRIEVCTFCGKLKRFEDPFLVTRNRYFEKKDRIEKAAGIKE